MTARLLAIVVLAMAACGDNLEPPMPACAELACVAIACGNLTPSGDLAPETCACELEGHVMVTCDAEAGIP